MNCYAAAMFGEGTRERAIWAAVVVLACCGDGQVGGDGGAGDASGGGTGGASGATGGTVGSGGTVSAGGGGGTTGARGGGGGGGVDDRLLPLEVGRRWMFQVSPLNPSSLANCARMESSVSGTAMDGADAGWIYAPACSTQNVEAFMDGDNIWVYPSANHFESERFQYALAPVQEGATWLTNQETFTWHDAGAVQTPAGRFERCWQRNVRSSPDSYIILCRGVGLVVSQSPSSNYRLELSSKNF
jgi:hypothetical protein